MNIFYEYEFEFSACFILTTFRGLNRGKNGAAYLMRGNKALIYVMKG